MYFKGKKVDNRPSSENFFGYWEEIKGKIINEVKEVNIEKILDVGTGFGRNLEFLLSLFENAEVYSIDPSREVIEGVKERIMAKRHSNFKLLVSGVENLDLPNDFFDLIVSVMALHHVEDLNRALTEMKRVLKRRGKVIIVDWKKEASELPFRTPHKAEDLIDYKEIMNAVRDLKCKVDDNRHYFVLTCSKDFK